MQSRYRPLRRLRWRALQAALVLLAVAGPADDAAAQEQGATPAAERNHPSVTLGPLTMDFRARFELDLRRSTPGVDEDFEPVDFNRRRVGVEGRLFEHIRFEIERELKDKRPWRDVVANVRVMQELEVSGGRFKLPFSAEALMAATDLPFAFRSRAAAHVAPARDGGVMVHGRFNDRRVAYSAGVFDGDGDNAVPDVDPDAPQPAEGPVLAGRFTASPWRHDPTGKRRLSLGVAATRSQVREGLNSLRGETVFGALFFPPVYTKGRRTRLGIDAAWAGSPWWARGEYMRSLEQRLNQGLGDVDLPDLVGEGWYASGGVRIAAVGLAFRYDALTFSSGSADDEPQRNPRAAHVLPSRDGVATAAVSWFVNRWVTLQGTVIHERISDIERSPVPGKQTLWGGVWRLRFVI